MCCASKKPGRCVNVCACYIECKTCFVSVINSFYCLNFLINCYNLVLLFLSFIVVFGMLILLSSGFV